LPTFCKRSGFGRKKINHLKVNLHLFDASFGVYFVKIGGTCSGISFDLSLRKKKEKKKTMLKQKKVKFQKKTNL